MMEVLEFHLKEARNSILVHGFASRQAPFAGTSNITCASSPDGQVVLRR